MTDIVTPSIREEPDILASKEEFLWSGKPKSGLLVRDSDLLAIPLPVIAAAIATQPYWNTPLAGMTAFSWLIVAGAGLVCLYFLIGRFILDAYERRNTFYGLTSERVLIRNGLFKRKTTFLDLRTLPQMELSLRSDGRGTITFGPVKDRMKMILQAAQIGIALLSLLGNSRQRNDGGSSSSNHDSQSDTNDEGTAQESPRFEAIMNAENVMAQILAAQAALAEASSAKVNTPSFPPDWHRTT